MITNQYNPYNTEALFKTFLFAEKISPVSLKNYLSDIRHFFGWLTFRTQSQIEIKNIDENNIIGLISLPIIEEYKSYLIDNRIPLKTINRRLSTLRKFCSFCISQGWLKENPAKRIKNQVSSISYLVPKKSTAIKKNILEEYNEFLKQKNMNENDVNNIVEDVKEFLIINLSLSKEEII